MSKLKFKVGDRVKYVGDAYGYKAPGVVTDFMYGNGRFPYGVAFEDDATASTLPALCREDELELIKE